MLRKENIKLKESEEKELRNQIIKEVYSFLDSPVVRKINQYGNSIEIEFERWIRFEDGTLVPHCDPVGPTGVLGKDKSECSRDDYSIVYDILGKGNKSKTLRNNRKEGK